MRLSKRVVVFSIFSLVAVLSVILITYLPAVRNHTSQTQMETKRKLEQDYRDRFREVFIDIGYDENDWRTIEHTKRISERFDGYIQFIIDAYHFGNEENKQRIEEKGLDAFIADCIRLEAGKAGYYSIYDHAKEQIDNFINSELPLYWPSVKEPLTIASDYMQQVFVVGWDSAKGREYRDLAKHVIMSAIDDADNERDKRAISEAAEVLLIEIPEGYGF